MVTNNKEYIKEYMRKYIKDSEQIKCPCGGLYKSYRLSSHNKTKRHIHYKTIPDKAVETKVVNESYDDLKKEIQMLKELIQNKL